MVSYPPMRENILHATLLIATILSAFCAGAEPFSPPPPYPGMEAWTFRQELATPERLAPVPTNDVTFVRAPVEGHESYKIDVAADGRVTITTEDDEGLRRAVYYYQDRVRAGDLASCTRKPWVRNRIARCFFGPIKRPPLNHDELMDDVDYYPEPYLDRLAHEGINGLWLTVEWRDLAETSFTKRSPDAPRRLAKLRRTVDRCLKYGIKTWIFCIEPKGCKEDDPLLRDHPELFGCAMQHGTLMCPLRPEARKYIEESVKDIFSNVPRLGGIMMISYGERHTTCLSQFDPLSGAFVGNCPRCAKLQPWQVHWETASAIMRGIRAAGSDAEYVSWFYQPHVRPERGAWSAEVARHLPDGVTLAYNFESGAIRDQLGRFRNGGDYGLSYVGPADGFRKVAEAGRQVGAKIGAKIQVGNSHEVATVPFVPVPGLLYRKYKAMRDMGVSTVLQCWYFGNYPGVMNKAAGELSFDAFIDDEMTFLRRLAAPYWDADAAEVAGIWKRMSDAYAQYPLSNDMQYYGPFHAGPAWPMLADVNLALLGRTWKPQDPPSGDAIGECLENHTIEEASILAARMAKGTHVETPDGRDALDALAARWRGDFERTRDIGVMKALALQFQSGSDIFSFYLDRAKAIYESRVRGDMAAARAAVRRMNEAVGREESVTRALLPLAKADSRLGFHSEAEAHQYHPAKLEWRLGELAKTKARLAEIDAALARGEAYPESEFERSAPSCRIGGDWTVATDGTRFRLRKTDGGDLAMEVELAKGAHLIVHTLDAAGVSWYKSVSVDEKGARSYPWFNMVSPGHEVVESKVASRNGKTVVAFALASAAWGGRGDRRPEWIQVIHDGGPEADWNSRGNWPLWPKGELADDWRLNLHPAQANLFGRIRGW